LEQALLLGTGLVAGAVSGLAGAQLALPSVPPFVDSVAGSYWHVHLERRRAELPSPRAGRRGDRHHLGPRRFVSDKEVDRKRRGSAPVRKQPVQ